MIDFIIPNILFDINNIWHHVIVWIIAIALCAIMAFFIVLFDRKKNKDK